MQKISPYDLTRNPFQLIEKQWAMITAHDGKRTNTMTASWGGVGIIWNKPVAFLFVRPQRFTRELIDRNDHFSVCFLPEQYRKELQYCGKVSGRDEDKLTICGFTATDIDDAPVLDQSELALTCRKLFRQQLESASFIDTSLDSKNYPNKDYHYMYIAEIINAYQ